MRLADAFLFLLAGQATAEQCHTPIGLEQYQRLGGKLMQINNEPAITPPANFFCDRVACSGRVKFAFVVDQAGNVKDLSIVENTWSVDPQYHADVITPHIMIMRYLPPRIGSKLVCVKITFDFTMKETG
jgi:hypothetical protein